MKAVVQDRYGHPDVLRVAEVERPSPGTDEVLIRVRATTVSQSDVHLRSADPFVWRFLFGLRRPRRSLGVELSGEVEEIGANVTEFAVGDRVFGQPSTWSGAYAEYLCVRADAPIARMPAGLTFDEAASVCDGAAQAIAALRTAQTAVGQRLVIYGASGSLGTAAVQLAKELGAHVTGVCGTAHVDLVRSLGADDVVDYRREDFTRRGPRYDALIDAVGKYSFRRGRRALRPGGIYVATDGGRFYLETLAWLAVTRLAGTKRVRATASRRNKPDVEHLRELIEQGRFRPVIDRRYPMSEVVEAHRYVETWRKAGNVVLTVP
jgi:NADPH:quinone reductase-like Zn-dependent oxidoreductase